MIVASYKKHQNDVNHDSHVRVKWGAKQLNNLELVAKQFNTFGLNS
jgi:hypothetical protein